jgi:hypothetical protein
MSRTRRDLWEFHESYRSGWQCFLLGVRKSRKMRDPLRNTSSINSSAWCCAGPILLSAGLQICRRQAAIWRVLSSCKATSGAAAGYDTAVLFVAGAFAAILRVPIQ